MSIPSRDFCYFNCNKEGPLITGGVRRIRHIIESSKERNDCLHTELQELIDKNSELQIRFHKTCVSTYTSKIHIERHKKRLGSLLERPACDSAVKRRAYRPAFDFKQCCLICGDACQPKDPKNPSRWRRIVQCKTVELREKLLQVANERVDEQAQTVQLRIHGALLDLHAADAQYHLD